MIHYCKKLVSTRKMSFFIFPYDFFFVNCILPNLKPWNSAPLKSISISKSNSIRFRLATAESFRLENRKELMKIENLKNSLNVLF